ncbi:MAG: HAMP domain-containing sensor histidine kinase, partial [Parvularculaceae bacterium]
RVGGSAGRAEARLQGKTPRAVDLSMRERPDGRRAVLVTMRPEASDTEETRALREEADAARREAKERADLLADLSHEMRTPLNAVIGFADAMKEETFGPLGHPKYGEYARHIRTSGGHLLDLVSSILDLAKIEADRFALKREIVDAGDLARECAGIIRLSAENAGLKLIVRIADELPEAALDARAVRQILLNLLSNAVKFTSDGEVSIDVRARGEDIVFTVADTGVGMSEAELSRLGARFTSASGDGVRGVKGNGLGLALAFALAELHGGSMKLESAPGEGMRATVKLPIREPAAPVRLHRTALPTENPFKPRAGAKAPEPPVVLTQLERIEAYRRERQKSAA